MAEASNDRLSGLFSTLAANPALLQSAMSLLGGLDPSALLKSLSPSAPDADKNDAPYNGPDLAAILASFTEESDSSNPKDPGEKCREAPVAAATTTPPHRSGKNNTQLLLALRPYLNAERRAMIDQIVQITRMMDAFVSMRPQK